MLNKQGNGKALSAHHEAFLQVIGRQAQLLQLGADIVPAVGMSCGFQCDSRSM